MNTQRSFVLAFDTANEVIAIGLGKLDAATQSIECVASVEVEARRASNTQLLPRIDELCAQAGVGRGEIACVAVGRGPGSFTGVRIALACAKGIASALEVGLVGVSSLDAVAWGAWKASERGSLLVVADAMRREVYPVEYRLSDAGAERVTADRVIKADAFAEELGATSASDRLIAAMPCASTWSFSKARASFCPRRCGRRRRGPLDGASGLMARGGVRSLRRRAPRSGLRPARVHAPVGRRGE